MKDEPTLSAIELRAWRQFLVLAEQLHFGRAAALLNMTQPPLTLAMQQMERRLGVALFERTRRSVALTPAGLALVEPVRQLLRQAAALPALAQSADARRDRPHPPRLHLDRRLRPAAGLAARLSRALPGHRRRTDRSDRRRAAQGLRARRDRRRLRAACAGHGAGCGARPADAVARRRAAGAGAAGVAALGRGAAPAPGRGAGAAAGDLPARRSRRRCSTRCSRSITARASRRPSRRRRSRCRRSSTSCRPAWASRSCRRR